MEKKEITEILDMPFVVFLDEKVWGQRRDINNLRKGTWSLCFIGIENPKVRDILPFTTKEWLATPNVGYKALDVLQRTYDRLGFRFGMTEEEIDALEGNTEPAANENAYPTLSFQDYINTLKDFADTAGACAIGNEVYTEDGYKITIKIEKVKQ